MPRKEHPKAKEKPAEQQSVEDVADGTAPEAEIVLEAPKADEAEVLRMRNDDLLNKLVYLQAEFENLQKRAAKERQEFVSYAQEGILRAVLPLLDDFDKAVEVVGEKDGGLGMLRAKLLKILEENGLNEIPTKDERFDPFLHDAVQFVNAGDKTDGTVAEVVRKGYRCNMKVLRPSLVVVVKNEEAAKQEGAKNA